MKKEIVHKTTSLSIIAVLVAGGLTFAIPSSAPVAHAQTNAMYVSAVNDTFENFFAGAQIIEVIINDQQFRKNNNHSFDPYVTVDGNHLPLYQSRSGNWYGYFVEADMSMAADGYGMEFGDYVVETTSYPPYNEYHLWYNVYGDRNVLLEPASPYLYSDVFIFAFDFSEGADIDVELKNSAQPETVTLTFDTVEDYASLIIDRSAYPLSAHIHMIIQDTWLNIDPTSEDWWTFSTYGETSAYYRLDPYYPDEYAMAVPTDNLMCNGNCVLSLNPGKQGETVVTLQDNGDTALMSFGDTSDPMSWQVIANDWISGPVISAGNIPITVYEIGSNTGAFVNTDLDGVANLVTTSNIGSVGNVGPDRPDSKKGDLATTSNIDSMKNTAVISYNDEETDILIGFGPALVDIRLEEGTWNSGESVAVMVLDMDSNLNTVIDETLSVSDANYKAIPTLKTGNPLVIQDNTTFMINGEFVGLVNDYNGGYDKFAARAILDVPDDVAIDTFTIDYDARLVDLRNVVMNEPNVFSYLNYDLQSFGAGVENVTLMIYGCNDVELDHDGAGQSYGILDKEVVRGIHNIACDDNASVSLEFALDGTYVPTGMHAIVADFMSFGYTDDGRQDSERVANQIIRIEAEEIGDTPGVFEGSLEYVMVNQLNMKDIAIFDDLDTISDAASFIVIEGLADEDSPRVSYSDLGSDGVVTQVQAQVHLPHAPSN